MSSAKSIAIYFAVVLPWTVGVGLIVTLLAAAFGVPSSAYPMTWVIASGLSFISLLIFVGAVSVPAFPDGEAATPDDWTPPDSVYAYPGGTTDGYMRAEFLRERDGLEVVRYEPEWRLDLVCGQRDDALAEAARIRGLVAEAALALRSGFLPDGDSIEYIDTPGNRSPTTPTLMYAERLTDEFEGDGS